jgi:hypothetical protein
MHKSCVFVLSVIDWATFSLQVVFRGYGEPEIVKQY